MMPHARVVNYSGLGAQLGSLGCSLNWFDPILHGYINIKILFFDLTVKLTRLYRAEDD